MCKKLLYLISFVLVLSLAGYVQAATITWTNAGGSGLWEDPGNWDLNAVPTGADEVRIPISPGPSVLAGVNAVAGNINIGQSAGNNGTLTVDGGTLTHTTYNLANNNGGTATINLKSGSITRTGTGDGYFPQFGSLTINITGGTWTCAGNLRIGHPSGVGSFTAHVDGGVWNINSLSIGRATIPRKMDFKDGILIIDGDKVEQFQGYIDEGWITAYDGNDFLSLDYDVTTPGKTTLKAAHVFLDAKPRDNTVVCGGSPVQLQWTLPQPSQPGGVVTVDIWFGTDPYVTTNPKIVNRQSVESVPVTLEMDKIYYWAIDVYDSSVSTTEASYLSPILRLSTRNQPPIVNAGADVATWPVNGERVVQLDGVVSDECGGPGPATLLWTVTAEPNALNPAQLSDPTVLNPTLTIREPGSYTLQFEASDGEFTASDTMKIVLYADSCAHARAQPGFVTLAGDLNNDCRVDFVDFAILAESWLQANDSIE